jgi:hypothetical protein
MFAAAITGRTDQQPEGEASRAPPPGSELFANGDMTMNRITAIRAPAPRPVQIARTTPHVTVRRRRRILTRAPKSDRSRVLAAFRALANGVDAHVAAARTTGFYRSSGFAWARCLA